MGLAKRGSSQDLAHGPQLLTPDVAYKLPYLLPSFRMIVHICTGVSFVCVSTY